MSRSNTNTEFTTPNKFIELLDVAPHNYVGDAGKVYRVNALETGLEPVSIGAIVNIGTITENHIPKGGANPPILQDTNVKITGMDNDEIEGIGRLSASVNKDLVLYSADGNVVIQDAYTLPNAAGAGEVGKVMTCTSAGFVEFQTPSGGGSLVGLYVAKTGNDTTGDGTIGNPFLTIGKAIAVAGSPSDPMVIYVMDGGEYDENLLIQNKIYIQAPYASLVPSAGSYAIRFDFNTQYKINFKLIVGAGGLGGVGVESINNGNIFLTCNEYYGAINAGDAWFHLQVNNIGGDMNAQTGKIIGYCTVNVITTIIGGTVTICQPSGIPIV